MEFRSRQGQEIFLFAKTSGRYWGPPSLLFSGGFFAGCKVAGNVTLTSRLYSAKVGNEWSYTFPVTICLGVDRDKFILFFNLMEFMPVNLEFGFRLHTGIVLCALLVSNIIYRPQTLHCILQRVM